MYFTQAIGTSSSSFRILRATRAKRTEPFGEPVIADELLAGPVASAPDFSGVAYAWLSSTGPESVYYTRFVDSRPNGTGGAFYGDTWMVTRQGTGWSMPAKVDLHTDDSQSQPFFTDDSQSLLFFTRAPKTSYAAADLAVTAVDGAGNFGPPTSLGSDFGNAYVYPTFPVLSADGRELIFQRQPLGGRGQIWEAVRSDPSLPLVSPHVVVMSPADATDVTASPGWLSPDGCRLYYSLELSTGGAMFVRSRALHGAADAGKDATAGP